MQGGFSAQVVGHPFETLEEIQMEQPQSADEGDNRDGHEDRRMFGGLECHPAQLNKKPEQLKAALVLKSFKLIYLWFFRRRRRLRMVDWLKAKKILNVNRAICLLYHNSLVIQCLRRNAKVCQRLEYGA